MEKDHENFLTNPIITNFNKPTLPTVSGVGRRSLDGSEILLSGAGEYVWHTLQQDYVKPYFHHDYQSLVWGIT